MSKYLTAVAIAFSCLSMTSCSTMLEILSSDSDGIQVSAEERRSLLFGSRYVSVRVTNNMTSPVRDVTVKVNMFNSEGVCIRSSECYFSGPIAPGDRESEHLYLSDDTDFSYAATEVLDVYY